MVTYYCTSPRHELVGPKKITCLKDGSYNAESPRCREIGAKTAADPAEEEIVPLVITNPKLPRNRVPGSRRPAQVSDPSDPQYGVKRIRRPGARPGGGKFAAVPAVAGRDKFRPEPEVQKPLSNEIPDSANVQNSPAAGADEPLPVEGQSETRQAQLNLGECGFCSITSPMLNIL